MEQPMKRRTKFCEPTSSYLLVILQHIWVKGFIFLITNSLMLAVGQ